MICEEVATSQVAIIDRDRSTVYPKGLPQRRESAPVVVSAQRGRAAATRGTVLTARGARVGGVLRQEASRATKVETHKALGHLWDRYLDAKEQLNALEGKGWARTEFERQRRHLCGRLVASYSPLVRYVVRRSSPTTSSANEDRVAWGMVGLLEAVETYDPTRGAKFETYAIHKIRWAILEGYRKENPCPRHLKFFARENERAVGELTQGLGRCPTEAEIAHKMDTSVKRYQKLLEEYTRTGASGPEAWLESKYDPSEAAETVISDEGEFDPQAHAERTELQEELTAAIGALEEKKRLAVTLYFYEGLKLKEIGKFLGLSEARISQILKRALSELRESLGVGNASLTPRLMGG
jgi:RNA polymerase sigma factor FliA